MLIGGVVGAIVASIRARAVVLVATAVFVLPMIEGADARAGVIDHDASSPSAAGIFSTPAAEPAPASLSDVGLLATPASSKFDSRESALQNTLAIADNGPVPFNVDRAILLSEAAGTPAPVATLKTEPVGMVRLVLGGPFLPPRAVVQN